MTSAAAVLLFAQPSCERPGGAERCWCGGWVGGAGAHHFEAVHAPSDHGLRIGFELSVRHGVRHRADVEADETTARRVADVAV